MFLNLGKKYHPIIQHCAAAVLVVAAMQPAAFAQTGVDPNLPAYERTSAVSGSLSSIGSDTLANLMTLWAESFQKVYPGVNVQIQAAGSSTAPPALTEGTSNLGPMSRKMKSKEIETFYNRHGYEPTAVPVALDALAVYVHRDNPIKGLSIAQVDAIFSQTRKCGHPQGSRVWGDVGLEFSWKNAPIELYGRNSVSGTYGYFKKAALCGGDFKAEVNEQPGSASVVQGVSNSLAGVGYSGIGYTTSGVRAVPLSKAQGGNYYRAVQKNVLNGSYPLARFLYVYVNKAPNRPLQRLEHEFIKMVLSAEGQEVVVKDGYVPLSAPIAAKVLATLN